VDDADAEFVGEGAEIPEADPALAETLVYTAMLIDGVGGVPHAGRSQGTSPWEPGGKGMSKSRRKQCLRSPGSRPWSRP